MIAFEFIWCLTKGVKSEGSLSFTFTRAVYRTFFTTPFFRIFKNLITLRYSPVCPPCLQSNNEKYQTDKATLWAFNTLAFLLRCRPRISKSGALICMLRSTFKLLHDWADLLEQIKERFGTTAHLCNIGRFRLKSERGFRAAMSSCCSSCKSRIISPTKKSG